MLRPAPRARRWRTLAGVLAALLAAPAAAVGSASAAQADTVRQQELWVLNAINVTGAWQRTHGSGVTVALIDSGVNRQVPDLTGAVLTGRDFSGVSTPPTNPNWGVHGTWMASLIAGHGHPPGGPSGIVGVAPAAKILSIRAVTDQGDPGYRRYQHESESRVQGHLAAAIRYATSKRVEVISMSLGYQGASRPVRAAISGALARGIVVVASSGNSGGTTTSVQHGNAPYSFPANYPGVLGVGAVAQSGQPAGFSSNNLSVQVAAPGVRVPAQGRDGQYWLVSGTSPACALAAGVAALIKSVYPALAPALVVQAITATTTNRPDGGYDEQVGFGTVDAAAALTMAGRLAHDQDTGRGVVAAAQFGGGPAAIPAVPVAPRGKRQLLVDSLIALACLAVALTLTFRLIATRRPAAAGAAAGRAPAAGRPRGRPGPGAPAGRGGAGGPGGPVGSATPNGRAGAAASGGWAGADVAGRGIPVPGAPGAGAVGGPTAESGPAAGYGAPPGHEMPAGYGQAAGYPKPATWGPPPAYGLSVGNRPPASAGPPPEINGPPPGSGGPPPAGYRQIAARPGVARGAGAPAGQPANTDTGPLAAHAEPQEPPAGRVADRPADDDDTWPLSRPW